MKIIVVVILLFLLSGSFWFWENTTHVNRGIAIKAENHVVNSALIPEIPEQVKRLCLAVTNNCQVCKLDKEEKVIGCSFPGIACSAINWRCVKTRKK